MAVEAHQRSLQQANAAVISQCRDTLLERIEIHVQRLIPPAREQLDVRRFIHDGLGEKIIEGEGDGFAVISVGGIPDQSGTGVRATAYNMSV